MATPDEMRTILKALTFPKDEILEDTLNKLLSAAVTVKQLHLLTKEECEEIGLVEEATSVIIKVRENHPL